MHIGQLVEVQVEQLGPDGLGRGFALSPAGQAEGARDRREHLIGNGLPGERGRALITHSGKNQVYSTLYELSSAPNEARERPACQRWAPQSPCRLMHLTGEAQLEFKRAQVISCLTEQGITAPVEPCVSAQLTLGWRSRLTYVLASSGGQASFGAFRRGSHDLQPMQACLLPEAPLFEATRELKKLLGSFLSLLPQGNIIKDNGCGAPLGLGTLRASLKQRAQRSPLVEAPQEAAPISHLALRTNHLGQVMACFLGSGAKRTSERERVLELARRSVQELNIHSVYYGMSGEGDTIFGPGAPELLVGEPHFIEEVDGLRFELSPRSFFQVHRSAAAKLQQAAVELVIGHRVLDVFSGVGALALRCAKRGHEVTSVESVPEASALALRSAELNGVSLHNITGDANHVLDELREPFDTCLVNPPRKGVGAALLPALARLTKQRMIYVSCNPRSLARDLAQLESAGQFRVRWVRPYDLFPASEHVEALAVLDRI